MSITRQSQVEKSWFEASARERVNGLLNPSSFTEFLGPEVGEMSPHLHLFDLPPAFDDGVVIGRGMLHQRHILIAAQEGRFMGGTFAEVSGAKIVGLLRGASAVARHRGPHTVILALDTGGVRLQEANAGELAVSETIRAILDARAAGVSVIALIGGRAGAFGGGGIVTAACSRCVVSQHGRISVSGPEVIETNKGVEEFDAQDRALVWRITGGRTRAMNGGADIYVRDTIGAFRDAAIKAAAATEGEVSFNLAKMEAEQQRLRDRLDAYGTCHDATEIWQRRKISKPEALADLSEQDFEAILAEKGITHDAR